MEVAPFSAKKSLVRNESGSLVVVLAIMGMIAGLIAYWSSLAAKVDKEVRSLGATQSTTFMRADFRNTIKKTLQGRNTGCPLSTTFNNKFKDFQVTTTDAMVEKTYDDNPATPINEVKANAEIPCFFNISRYAGLEWTKVKVMIRRTSEPDYMTLSNFISADVLATFKSDGKTSVLKYQLRYRIDVLDLNHYGVIFTQANSGALYDLDASSKVKIDAPVLFDQTDRNVPLPFRNLVVLPDTGRLIYSKETYSTAPSFSPDAQVIDFLTNKTIYDIFKKGLEYNQLVKGMSAPYQDTTQWNELLDFKPVPGGGYPLPNSVPQAVNYNPTADEDTFAYEYGGTNTAAIYNHIYGSGSEKRLIESCMKVPDITTGIYPLYIFNNLSQDFTIDFTKNTDEDFPPVFCGVIAAKDLIIILNGQDPTDPNYEHHIIGKFILKGKIKVQNKGSLALHDIMEFTNDQVQYAALPIDITELQTQFFNQKYYSTQNFFLPFFKPGVNPTVSDLQAASSLDRYYVPRSTSNFFNTTCHGGKKCRNGNIPTPDKEDLAHRHWQDLLFEVYDVE